MIQIATMMATSALVAWGVAAWVRHRAEALRLVQLPNHRSSHVQPTPNGGGLGIVVAGSLAGVGLVLFSGWTFGWFVLGLSALLAAVGLLDDIQHLPARVRFGVQVAVCAELLFWLGDLPKFYFQYGAGVRTGWLDFVWTIATGGRVVDQLVQFHGWHRRNCRGTGGLYVVGRRCFVGMGCAEVMSSPVWVLMLCVVAATVGFLLLNWPPAKIFMGDVGSTWLAIMVFALALLSVQAGWLSYATWLVLAAVFVTDATVTLLTRLLRGERWYEAHRNHAYQKLARRWGGHRPVT